MGSENGRLSCWCLLLVAVALHGATGVAGVETPGNEVASAAVATGHQHEEASGPLTGEEDDLDWEYLSGGNGGVLPPASKRAYYVSEFKRLPVYNFGLGKRTPANGNKYYAFGLGKRERSGRQYSFGLGKRLHNNLYSFGLGKRSMDVSENSIEDDDDDTEEEFEPDLEEDGSSEDLSEVKRAAGPYAFGLGKRFAKNQAYSFGLGKRASKYSFGLGKRQPSGGRQYSFGLGKRNRQYSFGLGKREISKEELQAYQQEQKKSAGRMYNFGLGKRAPAVSN
ncbi:allatostatins [Cloeon dipterum]|uniref:allatostatins n=1 Tax=Cloeon dipterum TaxID=197152 RepID=UPI00322077B1